MSILCLVHSLPICTCSCTSLHSIMLQLALLHLSFVVYIINLYFNLNLKGKIFFSVVISICSTTCFGVTSKCTYTVKFVMRKDDVILVLSFTAWLAFIACHKLQNVFCFSIFFLFLFIFTFPFFLSRRYSYHFDHGNNYQFKVNREWKEAQMKKIADR